MPGLDTMLICILGRKTTKVRKPLQKVNGLHWTWQRKSKAAPIFFTPHSATVILGELNQQEKYIQLLPEDCISNELVLSK